MSDMGDTCRAFREVRQVRHAEWYFQNMSVLYVARNDEKVDFRITNNGESLLFRERGKPNVDFFPSTGRWRVSGRKMTFSGGAQAFLKWYSRQEV